MTMKEKFVAFVEELMKPVDVNTIDPEILSYLNALKASKEVEKPKFTENGRLVLEYMQNNKDICNNVFKAKDIGEGLGISSRTASGAMRKLVTDGYVEKIGENPVVYTVTELGASVSFIEG